MNNLYLAHPYNRPPGRVINGFVCHYGIRGMRWGRRRFQNKDGSLTEAGKLRYAETARAAIGSIVESDDDKRARLLRSSDPIELYNNRHLLSSDEIKERINRINTETSLANLAASYQEANSPAAKGKKIIDGIVSATNTAGKVYAAWNSDAGKAARKILGLKVPNKNEQFMTMVRGFKDKSDKEILDMAQRMEALRRYERALKGTDDKKK